MGFRTCDISSPRNWNWRNYLCQHEEARRLPSAWFDEVSVNTELQSAGFLQKSCCDLYANQTVPRSLWAPSFQLQLGRELLLTYSLCWFCESESGLWNACSTFPTCVPLLGSPHKPSTLPLNMPSSKKAQLSGKSVPAQGLTRLASFRFGDCVLQSVDDE